MDGTLDLTLPGKQTQAKCIEQEILCYKEQNFILFIFFTSGVLPLAKPLFSPLELPVHSAKRKSQASISIQGAQH